MRCVFLSGIQRSGKTLTQLLLSSHPEIIISPGTKVIARLLFRHPRSRPLTADEILGVRRALQKDRRFKAWRVNHGLYLKQIEGYTEVTSRQAVLDLMSFFRDQIKPAASIIGNKKGYYCLEADVVKRVIPEAKFVFVIRDSRGAVSSMLETQPEHDIYSASLTWRLKAQRIRMAQEQFRDDVFVLRYESLVRDPERLCREMCSFLGLEYSPLMLTDYRTNDAVRHATDTTHPETFEEITTFMIDEWRHRLDAAQIRIVEGLTGRELSELGYELSDRRPRSVLEDLRYKWMQGRHFLEWWWWHAQTSQRVG
jgi:hypothetical protein